MKLYPKISISESARSDFQTLYDFLNATLSRRGTVMYLDAMLKEVNSLTAYADLYRPSRYMDIRAVHPQARHMVSHNKKWVFIFHIEEDMVVVDRILPAKLIKG